MKKKLYLTLILFLLCALQRGSGLNFSHMKTLVKLSYRNESAFTFIQEDEDRPGVLIAFLSHAIVELNINDPQNLKLVAGLPDRHGYHDGSGSNIRFSDPWDLVQLNRNSWIISDSGNNCLRDFNPSRNAAPYNTVDSITTGSAVCDPKNLLSRIQNTVSESNFHKPRGLAYVKEESKVYITYEKPYSLAEIYLSSKRVVVLYSSSYWKLRRIIPFHSEIIISTEPKYFLFSYRKSKLGTVVNNQWRSNTPKVQNFSRQFVSGVEVLPENKLFLETMNNRNVLALVDQENKVITKICSGQKGHLDANLTLCQLDMPRYIVNINNTLFIGEHGWSGGGIRIIHIYNDTVAAPAPIHSPPLAIICSTTAVAILIVVGVILGIVIVYRRKKKRQQLQKKADPIPLAKSSTKERPVPAPRTYGVNQHIGGGEHPRTIEHEYEVILEDDERANYNSGYEHAIAQETSDGYCDLMETAASENAYKLDYSVYKPTPNWQLANIITGREGTIAYTEPYIDNSVLGGYIGPDTIPRRPAPPAPACRQTVQHFPETSSPKPPNSGSDTPNMASSIVDLPTNAVLPKPLPKTLPQMTETSAQEEDTKEGKLTTSAEKQ